MWVPTGPELEQAAEADEMERRDAAALRSAGRRELSAVLPSMDGAAAAARRAQGAAGSVDRAPLSTV